MEKRKYTMPRVGVKMISDRDILTSSQQDDCLDDIFNGETTPQFITIG